MAGAGNALLGIGMGVGENRAIEAAMPAVSSPLLETSMDGARSILLSITGGQRPVAVGGQRGRQGRQRGRAPDANIIFGAMVDEKLADQVWVTVVATGYGERAAGARASARLQEPAGEPRVQRGRAAGRAAPRAPGAPRRGGLARG